MLSADGKMRLTDVADTEQLLWLIQSVPSKKAEPFKQWLAKVGTERINKIEGLELAFERAHIGFSYKLKPIGVLIFNRLFLRQPADYNGV